MTTVQAGAHRALGDALEREASRLASRLRGLPESRLARPFPPHQSRASAAHALAQQLADLAQAVAEPPRPEPAWRSLPWLGPFVVADQLTVTAQDLFAALGRLAAERADLTQTWVLTRSDRVLLADALAALTLRLRQLRLAL